MLKVSMREMFNKSILKSDLMPSINFDNTFDKLQILPVEIQNLFEYFFIYFILLICS